MRSFTPGLERAFNVVVSLTYSIAVTTTLLRLYRRRRFGRFWWDDWFAFLSLLGSLWLFVLFWLKVVPPGSPLSTLRSWKTRYWMGMLIYWITLWFTRISLALGTSRLFPPRHIAHRIGLASAIIFACFFIALLTAVVVECAPASSWGPPPGMAKEKVVCFIPKSSVYYSVSVGLLADVVLTAIPVWLLWRLKTSRSYRRLLLPGLCAGIVITMPTVALIVFQALPPSWEPMKSETRLRINFIEAATSVTMCNLVVTVTYVLRLLYGSSMQRGGPPATTESHSLTSIHRPGRSSANSHSIISFTDISEPGGCSWDDEWSSYDPDTMEQSISR
ncbi:hypothetical protein FA13DRAFT_1730707 [Coprinellus micaceus]|uniref:Rhodopsin domain-containing protein n=1 Tax=Coprinellus micaceus TaxID=71717 RepID=A0A4Y7TI67_COPMI|nr:hypothetical protein FA13DRAFT_1730707 [Coprinellus micaceus]